jgi:hypothetical protein
LFEKLHCGDHAFIKDLRRMIRLDSPELKDFGFLSQQMEHVVGGGSSNSMFLALAADQVLNGHSLSFPPLAPPHTNQPHREP